MEKWTSIYVRSRLPNTLGDPGVNAIAFESAVLSDGGDFRKDDGTVGHRPLELHLVEKEMLEVRVTFDGLMLASDVGIIHGRTYGVRRYQWHYVGCRVSEVSGPGHDSTGSRIVLLPRVVYFDCFDVDSGLKRSVTRITRAEVDTLKHLIGFRP